MLPPANGIQLAGRNGHRAGLCNGRIYCFGGRSDSQTLDELTWMDPKTGVWQTIGQAAKDAEQPCARQDMGLTVVDGQLWLFGGSAGGVCLDDLWVCTLGTPALSY